MGLLAHIFNNEDPKPKNHKTNFNGENRKTLEERKKGYMFVAQTHVSNVNEYQCKQRKQVS